MFEGKTIAALLTARCGVINVATREIIVTDLGGAWVRVFARGRRTVAALTPTRAAEAASAVLRSAFGVERAGRTIRLIGDTHGVATVKAGLAMAVCRAGSAALTGIGADKRIRAWCTHIRRSAGPRRTSS